MTVVIKAFQQCYSNDLLQCWNEALAYDPISEQRFQELILLDENFDSELMRLAIDGNRCVGFCYGIRRKIPYLERGLEPNRGWISIMGVLPEYQNRGIGTALVHEVEALLKQKGTKELTLCAYSPHYITPGIDLRYETAISFFEAKGYVTTGESVSMQRDLWEYQMSLDVRKKRISLEAEGIRILPYEDQYLCALLDYTLVHFGAGWKRNVLLAMQKKEAKDTILVCVDQSNTIIGFAMRKIDGNDSRFGPIGVNEVIRSKGIGGVLFECMMEDMRKRGLAYLYLLWTDGAAQRFYERHQVKVYRSYKLYRKELI